MRIGLLTSVPETLDAFFPDWVAAWRDAGHHVSPASGPGADGAGASLPASRVVAGVTRGPQLTSGTAHRHLRAWVRGERLDVVLTSTATASALVRTARAGVPVVYFCHGLHWGDEATWRDVVPRGVEGLLLRTTAAVISLNSADDAWFAAHLPPGHPHLRLSAGVGLNLDQWPVVPLPSERDVLRLVWVGEMSARKRPLDAVAVATTLAWSGVDVRLTMLGDGPLLAAVRADTAGASLVTAPGRADPRAHLADAHALLHTGAWEGLPRVTLEAAATGRSVHGYDVKGVRDAPGAVVAGRAGDVAALSGSVARWWRSGELEPRVDRTSLDWHAAFVDVTTLLEQVAEPAR